MPKFNLWSLKTFINQFWTCIHSKPRKLVMLFLSQKCQLVYPNKVNSPPIRQFPSFSIFGGHVTIFERSATRKPQDLLLGKNYFVPVLLVGNIANHSFEHTFGPGFKPLEWKIDQLRSLFRLTSGWNVWGPGRQLSLATMPKFADKLMLSPYHSKYLHHDLNRRPFLVPLV